MYLCKLATVLILLLFLLINITFAFEPENKEWREIHHQAGLLTKNGEHSRSIVLELKALEIAKSTVGVNHYSYAESLCNIAYAYEQLGEYILAEKYYKQALKISKKFPNPRFQCDAILRNNLGLFYRKIGSYDKAEAFYKEAMKIKTSRSIKSENIDSIITTLDNLAELYQITGRINEADKVKRLAQEYNRMD